MLSDFVEKTLQQFQPCIKRTKAKEIDFKNTKNSSSHTPRLVIRIMKLKYFQISVVCIFGGHWNTCQTVNRKKKHKNVSYILR